MHDRRAPPLSPTFCMIAMYCHTVLQNVVITLTNTCIYVLWLSELHICFSTPAYSAKKEMVVLTLLHAVVPE